MSAVNHTVKVMMSATALKGEKEIEKMFHPPRTCWRATLKSFWGTSIIQISADPRRAFNSFKTIVIIIIL